MYKSSLGRSPKQWRIWTNCPAAMNKRFFVQLCSWLNWKDDIRTFRGVNIIPTRSWVPHPLYSYKCVNSMKSFITNLRRVARPPIYSLSLYLSLNDLIPTLFKIHTWTEFLLALFWHWTCELLLPFPPLKSFYDVIS